MDVLAARGKEPSGSGDPDAPHADGFSAIERASSITTPARLNRNLEPPSKHVK
jgi:hypothetical protein